MKTFIKTLVWILSIIVSLLLILTCYFVFGKNKSILGYSSYINIGTSMLPSIDVGDLIISKKTDTLFVGDIITFVNKDGKTITHRISEINSDTYKTKGDNNKFVDSESVDISSIRGKMVLKIKYVGVILNYILNNKLMIIIGFLILIIFGLVLKYVC